MYNILDITKSWYCRMKHYEIKKMEKDKIYSADDVKKIFRGFINKDKQIKKAQHTFYILKRKLFYRERMIFQYMSIIFIKYAIKYCIL